MHIMCYDDGHIVIMRSVKICKKKKEEEEKMINEAKLKLWYEQ